MVVTKIRGGLGNQLFQWAAGLNLAQLHNTELFLDTSNYARNHARDFELEKLGIRVKIADEQTIALAKAKEFYKQPFFHFDYKFLNLADGTFLRGYFCSEKYFTSAAIEVKSILNNALNEIELNGDQAHIVNQIKSSESVAIHIRRGDYVSNSTYNDFFGTCSTDYYHAAISALKELQGDSVKFFVFSDDLNWAKDNLRLSDTSVFVDTNRGGDSYLDMLFMAECSHNIIANSTFSWWSAWSNPNPDKTVICPSKWFRSNYRTASGRGMWIKNPYYYTGDIYPSTWIAL